jgi:hypothetical protein
MATEGTIRPALPEWPQWLDLKTLARYACSGERTIREWIHRHNDPLPASQVAGKIRVNRSSFDTWMERQALKVDRVDTEKMASAIFSSISER